MHCYIVRNWHSLTLQFDQAKLHLAMIDPKEQMHLHAKWYLVVRLFLDFKGRPILEVSAIPGRPVAKVGQAHTLRRTAKIGLIS